MSRVFPFPGIGPILGGRRQRYRVSCRRRLDRERADLGGNRGFWRERMSHRKQAGSPPVPGPRVWGFRSGRAVRIAFGSGDWVGGFGGKVTGSGRDRGTFGERVENGGNRRALALAEQRGSALYSAVSNFQAEFRQVGSDEGTRERSQGLRTLQDCQTQGSRLRDLFQPAPQAATGLMRRFPRR